MLEPDAGAFNFNASFGAREVCEHEDVYCQRNLRDTLAPNYTVGEFGWNGSSARILGHTCAKHNFTVPFQDGVAAFSGLYVLDMASDMKLRFTLQSANPASHRRIFLETASFDVPGEPVRIIAKGPVSTSATGGAALAAQPHLEIVDAGGRLTTYERGVTVTATLRAVRKQAGGCPAGQPFSCLAVSPDTDVCAIGVPFCPTLRGTRHVRAARGRADFTDLAITTCNDRTVPRPSSSRGPCRCRYSEALQRLVAREEDRQSCSPKRIATSAIAVFH